MPSRGKISDMRRVAGLALATLLILQNCYGCLGAPGYASASEYSSSSSGGSYGGAPRLTTVAYNSGASDKSELSNSALSGALTTYLKHHRLPLVGANVITESD